MGAMKDARNRAKLTQAQASEASGIPLGTLRRWEQGVNEPPIEAIVQLADLYGVSTDELLGSGYADAGREQVTLTADERELLAYYRRCSDKGRSYVMGVANVTSLSFPREA